MKLTFSIILSFASIYYLNAQTIDSANFQCLYKLTYTKDLLKPEKVQTDEMLLLVGDKFILFSSYTNYIADSLQKANPAEHKPKVIDNKVIPARTPVKKTDNKEQFFINRTTGELVCMSLIVYKDYYQYTEKGITPVWKIYSDTQPVLGYTCQKATTQYGGRDWTVWFAPEIAIGEGPWKLRGLPGLILKAEDKDKHYAFECTGLQRLNTKKRINRDNENTYRILSKSEFSKENEKFYNDPLSYLDVKVAFDTKPIIRKYNPIELSE